MFDCLAEGIATLFVFAHASGVLALAFSFTRMLPSIHGFWFGNVLIVAMGTTSSMHFLMNSLTESAYSSMLLLEAPWKYPNPRERSSLEAWNQISWISVEQT